MSLNLKAVENIKQSDTVSKATGVKPASDVAGTPNWSECRSCETAWLSRTDASVAPEVISLDGASPASDIWSLGCTIIELLTGKPPYWDVGNSMSGMSGGIMACSKAEPHSAVPNSRRR